MWPFNKKPTTTEKHARLTIYTNEAKVLVDLSIANVDGFKDFFDWYDDTDGDNQMIFGNAQDGQRWGVSRSAIGGFYHCIEDKKV